MKLKKLISGFLAFTFAVSLVNFAPKTVSAVTQTVSQTVFEMDINALKAGTVPTGVTFNSSILDETATSASAGLISDVMSDQTAFLTLDLEAMSQGLQGEGTGIYTIEVVVNQNDSDDTKLNGMLMSMTGIAKKDVWRVRENADVAVLNSWTSANSLFSSGNKNSATASYVFTDLNVNTGAIASHAAKYGTSPVYNGYANGQAVAAGNASAQSPINIIEFRTAKTSSQGAMRANIKSIKITRMAQVEIAAEMFEITASSEDVVKGTVSVSGVNAENKAAAGSNVTLTAVASAGYIFDGWYKDGADTAISTDAEYTIEASSETAGSYVAKFIKVAKINQTVFELDIESLVAGTVPAGVTLNRSILDEINSSNENGLISDVVSGNTDFLTINLATATAGLTGTGTGLYSIELITNVNDSDQSTDNGTMMYLKGINDHLVFRARENSDICAMPNTWTDLHWQPITGETASYGIENLNIYDGSADAHYARRNSSPQYEAYANGHALAAGNANAENPINILTLKAANTRRANIKSLKIVREAIVQTTTYIIGAEAEDDTMGSVSLSDTSVETGESVTLTATAEANHVFAGWYDKDTDELVSTSREWTFVPTESKIYVAKFTYIVTYNITAESADIKKGTVTISPEASYLEGDEVTLKATALSGYIFDGWYRNGEKVSSSTTYVLTASAVTEGVYFAKFISAEFREQQVYTFDIEGILDETAELPAGITLNDAILDSVASADDDTLKSQVKTGAESFITINFAELVQGLGLEGADSGIYKAEIAVNVKDEADEENGTDVFAVNNGGEKLLLTASETSGVKASKGDGVNGGGDSYNRTYVTYTFELNVADGTLTSKLTDQTGSNIFSSVANGQTVTVPGITGSDPVTKLVIKNIAGQRANIKSIKVSRNISLVDYGNDTPIFNETCVKLIGVNGETLSGNSVTAAVKTIAIDFRSVLDDATVNKNTIYIEKGGVKLDAEPVHNDGIVVFNVNGLLPGSSYTVAVTGGVKNKEGVFVRNAGAYSFTTKAGECAAEIISTKIGASEISAISGISQNDEIDVAVKYINTNESVRDLYVVYTAYKNNKLSDVKIAEYKNIAYTISAEFNPTFTAGDMTDITAIRIYAFDSWNTKNILDVVDFGAALVYTKSATETKVKVDNSENKMVISGIANDEDGIWIEIVKGNKQHSQIFEGLSKVNNVYESGIPVVFFDTVKGSFSLDVPVTETDDYTVYVKNMTTKEMLIDGEVITFADATTYESLVNGLDTSSESAFVASLTDDVAKKLGMDILVSPHLSSDEKTEVKEKLYAEGLSATDDESNKKMCNEYAAMAVINNNTTVSADVAAVVMDCLTDTVNADSSLKDWYGRYITDATKETSFVNKLLATEPASEGAEKIALRSNLTDALKVALVLEIAKAPNGYTNIGTSFDLFKSAFGRESVSTSNDVYEKMVGTYANKSAFLKKYDDIVTPPSDDPSDDGQGTDSLGGVTGGFTIGGGGGAAEETETPNKATPMEKNIFNDIESVPWAQEAIVALKVKNVIDGKTETEFCPNDKITREEFTKLIVAAFANEAVNAEISFDDARTDAWYYSYIQKAKGAGLVNGMSDAYFGVGHNITRQDMAVMIFNAAKYKNVIGNSTPEEFPFGDDGSIANYAKEAIYTLKTMGIINGVDSDNFAPLSTATRAEATVMIYRLLLK